MHNYQRQKQKAAHPKLSSEAVAINSKDDLPVIIFESENLPILSLERWSTDPFDSFPVKMQPYMFELLQLCE